MRKKLDLSEVEFVKAKNERIKVYGLARGVVFGDLNWGEMGTINKVRNEFHFFPKWNVKAFSENFLFQIHKKLEELNK